MTAQATQTVAPNDGVYAFIDRLVGARMVDTVLFGQRSMSRREVGRIIAEARTRVGEAGWLADRLREYAGAFPESMVKAPSIATAEANAIFMESPGRGIA